MISLPKNPSMKIAIYEGFMFLISQIGTSNDSNGWRNPYSAD